MPKAKPGVGDLDSIEPMDGTEDYCVSDSSDADRHLNRGGDARENMSISVSPTKPSKQKSFEEKQALIWQKM